ncbi:unnamed protein product [Phytophthora lilii]|uniref:Unnamed protein product n=1 Tax=Phytophthora lilii TaxID=2077276 RepID=A0A9W6YJB2_9STRA|nr:unnamed protein product [Phytophthora lilii]
MQKFVSRFVITDSTSHPLDEPAVSSEEGEDVMQLDEALGSRTLAKKKKISPDEDYNLATAWLEISQDPVVGDEQKKHVFWRMVHIKFIAWMQQVALAMRSPCNESQQLADALAKFTSDL